MLKTGIIFTIQSYLFVGIDAELKLGFMNYGLKQSLAEVCKRTDLVL
jgi:hypothetical protein